MYLLKQILSLYFVIPAILLAGLYLSWQLRWLQLSSLRQAVRLMVRKRACQKGTFTSFSALAAVLGGNLGTGNIAGMAVALSMGGPGSLFWMWIMAILGAIIKFAGCYLGVKYRIERSWGFAGGPMYYLQYGLKKPWLAKIFCLLTILSACTVGNLVQINSIALPLTSSGASPWLVGMTMALLVALVLWAGSRFFSDLISRLVPFMAAIYLFACGYILIQYTSQIIPSLKLILMSAFALKPVVGGLGAYYLSDGILIGVDRGLFATDAGVGIAPILHAGVAADGPKITAGFEQGIISILAPMLVMLLCLITGLVLLVTGAWNIVGLESTNVCIKAFQIGFNWDGAGHIVNFTLFLFAFTTILTWAHCGKAAMHFMVDNDKYKNLWFKVIFVLLIPVGAIANVKVAWSIADIALNLMLLVNIFGVLSLSKELIDDVRILNSKI